MEEKIDLRIVKTKKALSEAMIKVLKEKKFEDITVSDLCEEAMVRRATFYKHFADKYECFSYVMRKTKDDYYEKQNTSFENENILSYCINNVHHIYEYSKTHEKLANMLLNSNASAVMSDIIFEDIANDMEIIIKRDIEKGAIFPAAPELMAHFLTGTLLNFVRWLGKKKNRIPEETLVENYEVFFRLLVYTK